MRPFSFGAKMDRVMIYPGAIPLETDLLTAQKNDMIGLAKLAAAVLGTATQVNGLACTPTNVPSMQVTVGAGEIYSLQNIDNSAYSSIAADTAHQIVKQGILLDAVTLTTAAPATAGMSVVYLVEAAYIDVDTLPVTLPYYNSSNPSQAYSGPANAGTTNNTARKGQCSVQLKTGIAATTGSQVAPAVDAGYVALYTITVANGQTTVLAANIATVSSAPFIGSFVQLSALQSATALLAKLTGATFSGPILGDTNVKMWMGGGSIASNAGVGSGTLASNVSGMNLTAVGTNALNSVTSGSGNSGFGASTLTAVTAGTGNAGFGVLAGADITTGSNNSIFGTNTGRGITTGSGNTIIGSGIASLAPALANNIIIGNGAGTQAQFDGTNWAFQGSVSVGSATTAAHAVTYAQTIGLGQTWQNMSSSRAFNTTYTNSSTRPITVSANMTSSNTANAAIVITQNSVAITVIGNSGPTGSAGLYITTIIPPGASYIIAVTSGTAANLSCFELR